MYKVHLRLIAALYKYEVIWKYSVYNRSHIRSMVVKDIVENSGMIGRIR